MAYILDILIIIILAVCVWRGVKKGFIKAAFSILTFLLAALLSFMFYVPFSEFVTNTSIGQNVSQSIQTSVYKAVSGDAQNDKENAQTQESTGEGTTEGIISNMKLPSFMFSSVFEQSDFLMRTARVTAAQAVSTSLSTAFMKLISGILLFVLILIGLWIIKKILEFIFKLPLLKEANKLAGFIAGIINGVLISYLVIAICVSLSGFSELSFIKDTIDKSYMYNNFYQSNMIAKMFVK